MNHYYNITLHIITTSVRSRGPLIPVISGKKEREGQSPPNPQGNYLMTSPFTSSLVTPSGFLLPSVWITSVSPELSSVT